MFCSRLQASTGNKFWADQKMPTIPKSWKDIENAPWTLAREFAIMRTNIEAYRFIFSSCWLLLTHTVHYHVGVKHMFFARQRCHVAHPAQGLESLYKAICARYNAEEAKEPQELQDGCPKRGPFSCWKCGLFHVFDRICLLSMGGICVKYSQLVIIAIIRVLSVIKEVRVPKAPPRYSWLPGWLSQVSTLAMNLLV